MSLSLYEKLDLAAASQHSGDPQEATPICLGGGPGTGKTSVWRSWAESRNYWLDPWGLSKTLTPDLGGMYMPNEDKSSIIHIRTGRILGENVPEGYNKVLILFDEFDKASPAQQGALCAYIEGRNVDGVKIPDNVIFGFTMNRKEDQCGGNQIIHPMRNRMWYIDMASDAESWLPIAAKSGVHPLVMAFIKNNPRKLNQFDPKSKDMSYATERSWTKAGRMINRLDDINDMTDVVRGIVGDANALELSGWLKLGGQMTPIGEIYENPEEAGVPSQPDVTYAIICNLMNDFSSIGKSGEEIGRDRAEAVIKYLRRMEDSFAVFGFRMLGECNPDFKNSTEEWSKFRSDYSGLMSL
jgi:hypothetical protein